MPVEELNEILQAYQPFQVVEGTSQLIADNGSFIGNVWNTVVSAGAGLATSVAALCETVGGVATTTGIAIGATSIPTAAIAAVPFLGLAAGLTLYNLEPGFWDALAQPLIDAGETINGNLITYFDQNGNTSFSENALNIIKNYIIDANLFDEHKILDKDLYWSGNPRDPEAFYELTNTRAEYITEQYIFPTTIPYSPYGPTTLLELPNPDGFITRIRTTIPTYMFRVHNNIIAFSFTGEAFRLKTEGKHSWTSNDVSSREYEVTKSDSMYSFQYAEARTQGEGLSEDHIMYNLNIIGQTGLPHWGVSSYHPQTEKEVAAVWFFGDFITETYRQPDAIIPNIDDSVTITYNLGDTYTITLPQGDIVAIPIEIPPINPDPSQEAAQNPSAPDIVQNPNDDPEKTQKLIEWLLKYLNPNGNPADDDKPGEDNDQSANPDPLPDTPVPPVDNPPDPNTTPEDGVTPALPTLPDFSSSSAMYTVYNPTQAEINSLGAYLWSTNIVEILRSIWQDPMDGIITFNRIYCDVPTSGRHNIILGTLDSGVNSLIVPTQFTTVSCGSITVNEYYNNATDYRPYTQCHLYLPFIGIVELNTNDIINSQLTLKYNIDLYTGCCIAELSIVRSIDMKSSTILYTYTGNCAQQLPLTGASYKQVLQSVIGIATSVAGIASGGALAFPGAAMTMSQAFQEQVHLQRASSLAGNAGILGGKQPYLIITRQQPYDANGYNELTGYPSNATVFLSNCTGYTKVKAIHLNTRATQLENIEIESLLKEGVIF